MITSVFQVIYYPVTVEQLSWVNSRCAELAGDGPRNSFYVVQASCRGRSQHHMTRMKIAETLDPDDRGIHLVVDSDIPFLYLKESIMAGSIKFSSWTES